VGWLWTGRAARPGLAANEQPRSSSSWPAGRGARHVPTDTDPLVHAWIASASWSWVRKKSSLVKIPYHKQPNQSYRSRSRLYFILFLIHWQPILGFHCRRRDLQPQKQIWKVNNGSSGSLAHAQILRWCWEYLFVLLIIVLWCYSCSFRFHHLSIRTNFLFLNNC
jgi:hypothetical protein